MQLSSGLQECPRSLDNRSRNGIFLNGHKVSQHGLQHLDTIVIGDHVMRFEDAREVPASGTIRPLAGNQEPDQASSVSLPALANHAEYQNLFSTLLRIQRILSRDGEDIIPRSLDALFHVLPATRLSLLDVSTDGELRQSYTITPFGPSDNYIGAALLHGSS